MNGTTRIKLILLCIMAIIGLALWSSKVFSPAQLFLSGLIVANCIGYLFYDEKEGEK